MRRRAGWPLALALIALPAAAQRLEPPTCYPELGPANSLAAAVDDAGVVHLSRHKNVPADLMYTAIDPDGAVVRDEVVLARANDIARPVRETDVVLQAGQPRICFHQPFGDAFRVALRGPDGAWQVEQVDAGPRVGEQCSLLVHDGALVAFYVAQGTLKRAIRRGADDWQSEVVFAGVGGQDAGADVDTLVDDTGREVAVHRSSAGFRMYVTRQDGPGWVTETLFPDGAPFGMRIAVAQAPDGTLVIAHGRYIDNVDVGPDLGLFLTRGPVEGPLLTEEIRPGTSSGGSNALALLGVGPQQRVALLTRERRRSALVGSRDAIAFLPAAASNVEGTAREAIAGGTRDFHPITLSRRPDGRALVAWHEVTPGQNLLQLCVLPVLDEDGDDLPDALEAGPLGTRPDRLDSDGDGRDDGQEVLDDRTDPGVPDDPPDDPDMAAPDMAAPDMAELDMAAPDVAVPDMAEPDMAAPDVAVPDMAAPDMAAPDMAAPDMAAPDGAVPDMTMLDMAVPDMAAVVMDMAAPVDLAAPQDRSMPEDQAVPVDSQPVDQAMDLAARDAGLADAEAEDSGPDSAAARDAQPADALPADAQRPPSPRDARPPRDAAPRYDGDLPPLDSLTPTREDASCGSCAAGTGLGDLPLWLLILALPWRRRR